MFCCAHYSLFNLTIPNQTQKYDSFTMHALTVDWNTIFQQYVKSGGNPVDLIEPTDGTHTQALH